MIHLFICLYILVAVTNLQPWDRMPDAEVVNYVCNPSDGDFLLYASIYYLQFPIMGVYHMIFD